MLEIEQAQGQQRHRRAARGPARARASRVRRATVADHRRHRRARRSPARSARPPARRGPRDGTARPPSASARPRAPRVSRDRRLPVERELDQARSRRPASANSRSMAALRDRRPRSDRAEAGARRGAPSRRRRDRGRHARPVQLDQQHVAGVVGAEAIGLGRARVPGPRGDLERAMPVAQRQIVEPRAGRPLRRRSGWARRRPRADGPPPSRAPGRRARRPTGVATPSIQAVRSSERTPRGQRRRQHDEPAVGRARSAPAASASDHVGGPAQALQPAPDAFGQRRRRDCPAAAPRAPAKPRIAASAWTMVRIRHEIGVEHITGDQDGRRPVRGRRARRSAAHRLEAGLAQQRADVARQVVERLAELPVGGVEQAQASSARPPRIATLARQALGLPARRDRPARSRPARGRAGSR